MISVTAMRQVHRLGVETNGQSTNEIELWDILGTIRLTWVYKVCQCPVRYDCL